MQILTYHHYDALLAIVLKKQIVSFKQNKVKDGEVHQLS